MENTRIYVTQPFLPPLDEFNRLLEVIWKNKWLTNNGEFHQSLENELQKFLEIPYISLFSNGTIALISALQSLDISGEVITTPYSFIATAHSVVWNNLTPVFVDIDPEFCNLDTSKIEAAITEKTTAILPVHVYGNPCDVEKIEKIAQKHGLKVIYDAAHAFGVRYKDTSLLNYGDLSILSFHATKCFHTFEGGAIISHSVEMKKKIDYLKNFGIDNETSVVGVGINGKMNEIQAAMGLINLKYYNLNFEKRKKLHDLYKSELKNIKGIRLLNYMRDGIPNYSYFPIFFENCLRDRVYDELKIKGFYSRKYFYPLISTFEPYCNLPSSSSDNLLVAHKIASEVLCLPIYPDLEQDEVRRICETIKKFK